MLSGKVSSEDIVTVYAKRCIEIGRKLNLVATENFEEAIEIAKKRDKELKEALKEGKEGELGLLHGIPISVKDHVRGMQFTFQ